MGGGGGVRRSDNLELSVWKEARPSIRHIIKPYLTPNYFFDMLLQDNALANAILSLFVAAHYVCAVPDSLPALSDHHANPDPGLAAVLRAFNPHRTGKQPPAGAHCCTQLQRGLNHCLRSLISQRDLLGIQRLLNSTEFNVHQLTALLDCRGLHKARPQSEHAAFLIGCFAQWRNKTLNFILISLCSSQSDRVRFNCQCARRLY